MEETIANEAAKILEADKEEVERMVANNAFILKEMKEKATKIGEEKGIKIGEEKGIKIGEEKGIKIGEKKGIIISRREAIIDILSEIEPVTDDVVNMINSQEDIEILKKWLKISAKVESVEEFKERIEIR